MIKNCVKRKLIITTFALLVFLITLTFPKTEEEIKNVTITYTQNASFPIYLLDKDEFVARTSISLKSTDVVKQAKELIAMMTIDNASAAYIPNLFAPILPKNTRVLSIDVQDTTLKVNLSQEFLNIPKGYEEKVLECLVYSLTELEGVDSILLYVEGDVLDTLPNTNEKLPLLLTRDIGVNKIYDLTNLKDVTKTTTYYIAKENDFSYYIPVTLLSNSDQNKVEIVIERLKTNPNIKTNLISYLSANTEIKSYELLEEEIALSFSPVLYEGIVNEDLVEEVKYSISLSLMDTLHVKNVTFVE